VAYAEQRCNSISQQNELDAGHDGLDPAYGENLFWGGNWGPDVITCAEAVQSWY